MRSAPAVYFPVGRSRWHGLILALWTLFAVGLGALWLSQKGLETWRLWAQISVLAVTGAWAWYRWQTAPRGTLRWDGQQWHWMGRNPDVGEITPWADLQFALLLHWRSHSSGAHLWFWVERRAAPTDWQALRRAVFA